MPYVILPNSGQSLGQTRAAIRNNFILLKTTIDQNHNDMDASNTGKHFCIQMPVQGALPVNPFPPGGFVAGDANIWGKTLNAESQIMFTPDNSTDQYQMTRSVHSNFSQFATLTPTPAVSEQTSGWTFLPGGLLFQYGTYLHPILNGSGVITFPVTFTNPPLNIQITPIGSSGSGQTIQVNSLISPTNSNFNWIFTAGSGNAYTGFYWHAIGA